MPTRNAVACRSQAQRPYGGENLDPHHHWFGIDRSTSVGHDMDPKRSGNERTSSTEKRLLPLPEPRWSYVVVTPRGHEHDPMRGVAVWREPFNGPLYSGQGIEPDPHRHEPSQRDLRNLPAYARLLAWTGRDVPRAASVLAHLPELLQPAIKRARVLGHGLAWGLGSLGRIGRID